MTATDAHSIISGYRAARARLNGFREPGMIRPAPIALPRPPTVPKAVPLEVVLSCYRKAFDSDPAPEAEKKITLKEIISEVCEKRGVSKNAIISARRNVDLVLARQEVMWRAREETTLSLPQIGRALGNRDHTTVLHGMRRYQGRIDAGDIC
jgi:chromosomal replication initiator protein